MKYAIFIWIFSLFVTKSYAQNICELNKSKSNLIFKVDADDIICLAKKSNKEKILVYTFGTWCAPCLKHLPNAIGLAKNYDLDFYVLLIDKENSQREFDAIEYLNQIQEKNNLEINRVILKDSNGRPNKKYKLFLDKITPNQFENINDMSKYILIDNLGNVLMVTNWKDNRENNWEDDSKMIEKKIIPLLE
jgi:thiol-disulfide isomerase/thioredoxin|tara:strand:- start:66 stop:638 length:573 start_codon:yes stop_codon:yes gene_type:complete